MVLRSVRSLLVYLLVAFALLGAAGCGDDAELPSDAVATVGDTAISQRRLLEIMTASPLVLEPGSQGARVAYSCWLARRKLDLFAEQADTSDPRRARCRRYFDRHAARALQTAIQADWYAREAERRGIPSELEPPYTPELRAALEKGGLPLSSAELVYRRLALRQRLLAVAQRHAEQVPDSAISRYYEANKDRYREAEQRYVRAMLVSSKARAEQVREQLQNGGSWGRVNRLGQQDAVETVWNGLLINVYRIGEPSLERAAFKSKRGEVAIVRGQHAWIVYQVLRIQPARLRTLGEVSDEVASTLAARRVRRAQAAFARAMRDRYRERTVCADGFAAPECSDS
jgi:hypothetical protein